MILPSPHNTTTNILSFLSIIDQFLALHIYEQKIGDMETQLTVYENFVVVGDFNITSQP